MKGRTFTALVQEEPDRETGLFKAMTDNYLSLLIDPDPGLANRLVQVRLDRVQSGTQLFGSVSG